MRFFNSLVFLTALTGISYGFAANTSAKKYLCSGRAFEPLPGSNAQGTVVGYNVLVTLENEDSGSMIIEKVLPGNFRFTDEHNWVLDESVSDLPKGQAFTSTTSSGISLLFKEKFALDRGLPKKAVLRSNLVADVALTCAAARK